MPIPLSVRATVGSLLLGLLLTSCGTDATPAPGRTVADSEDPTAPTEPAPSPTTVQGVDAPAYLVSAEPVVRPLTGDTFVNPGAIVFHDGTFHMFANSFDAFPGDSRTAHWTSSDAITWELAGADPVFGTEDVPFADATVFLWSVDVEDGQWTGWFYTFDGGGPGVIGRATATAPDGPWVADPEPVLLPAPRPSFDDLRVGEPHVLRTEEGYRMYYTGTSGTDSAIGLATSPDGVTWTRHDDPATEAPSDPVFEPSGDWDRDTIDGPRVLVDRDGWTMFYTSSRRNVGALGVATSTDGLTWEPHPQNPIASVDDLDGIEAVFQHAVVLTEHGALWLPEMSRSRGSTAVEAGVVTAPNDRGDVAASAHIVGNRVSVTVELVDAEIGFDPSSRPAILHPHLYIDRPPPRTGQEVRPGQDGIVHSRTNELVIDRLSPGRHTLWVVLADGADLASNHAPVRLDVTIDDE